MSDPKHWHREIDEQGLLWLSLDRQEQKTNALSREVLQELDTELEAIQNEPPRAVVIRSAKEGGFIAGADIEQFTQLHNEEEAFELIRQGQKVFDKLQQLPCPSLALIHGYCLGGGLELALACTYRIAEDAANTKLGLPEVMLGIHPGFGGSVRLPGLIGDAAALDMMLSGRSVDARKARRLGLVDLAVPRRQLHNSVRGLLRDRPKPHRPTLLQRLPGWPGLRGLVYKMTLKKLRARANPKHYPAPFAQLELWRNYTGNRRMNLLEEARSVARLIMGPTAQNLVRVFFLQEKLKGLGKSKGKDQKFKATHVHVVGGGVMGGDIASWCALQGLTVTLQDRQSETLGRAMARAHKLFKRKLKRPRPIQDAMDRLIPDIEGHGIARADVVVEAIFEDLEVKQNLFRELEGKVKPEAILATNTSSIPLEEIASVLQEPARLIGLHFFNPVAKMQLVEVVHGENSSSQSVQQACAFARQISRLPLPVKSSPGFLVNRILMPYLLEAVILESEGVPITAIDQAALDFGMPMGPIRLADTVGLDICLSVARILGEHLGLEVPERLSELVDQDRLGAKSGQGFYRYEKGNPLPHETQSSASIPTDLTDRLMMRLINEAMACLREGVVDNSDLLDAGVIFGTGFAPFRGGPLHYIEENDIQQQRIHMLSLQEQHGPRFTLDAGWEQSVSQSHPTAGAHHA